MLVIKLEIISDGISYWSDHALICKFMGLRLSLLVLEMWEQRVWNPEGDMEMLLAANNYFIVVFSCMSDSHRAFEGGPYFFNKIELFAKPWHARFNLTQELPSRVLAWVRLPRLPLEFWKSDILHSIALLLGKLVGSATQTQDKKVISFSQIRVEVDLNNPLLDSIEFFLGTSSWIQQLDYETLPFRCCLCHEYGHLQRKCPQFVSNTLDLSTPSSSIPRKDKGKEPMVEVNVDKEGFIPVKSRNKGRGQKRT